MLERFARRSDAIIKWMHDTPPTSQIQQRLIDVVLGHLFRISDLSRVTAQALSDRNEALVTDLDKQAELALGEKERSLGAFKQHRQEHGC